MKPYLLMTVVYLSLAVLALIDSAFAGVGIVTWFNGLRWLRVHFITLGVITQLVFGFAPYLVTARTDKGRPAMRWSIWIPLNLGVLILLIGILLVNTAIITMGGTLVFIATLLLLRQLIQGRAAVIGAHPARKFYIAGLGYLLLGIFLGTGLWQGWGPWIGLANPKEVHVHSNLWGLTSLVFAGLLVDVYGRLTHRPIAGARSINAIFGLITFGALGMVIGPWIEQEFVTSSGLVLHTVGTLLLLWKALVAFVRAGQARLPGMWHLISAYVWFLIPAAVAPLIVANATNFPVGQVSSNGSPILIYGWIVQFGFALIPYLFAVALEPSRPASLGGSWFGLTTMHVGSVLYWAGLFLPDAQPWLHASAFGIWAVALVPLVWGLWQQVRTRVAAQVTQIA